MTGETTQSDSPGNFRVGVLILAASIAVGVPMGVMWVLLAPRTALSVKNGSVIYAQVTEAAVGADLVFALLGIGCGLLVSSFALWRWRSAGVEVAVFVALGGVLGSALAWRIGCALIGGDSDTGTISAAGRAEGVTFEGPLQLDSPGALGLWSLAGLVVVFLVFWRRGRATARRIDAIIERNAELQGAPGG